MTRVDFYVLGSGRPDAVVTALAANVLGEGQRLLIAEADEARRKALSEALWQARPESFLANGLADQPHAARQPILLSEDVVPLNEARLLCLADGRWRETEEFERVFYLFGDETLGEARAQWKRLGEHGEIERHFWKQDSGGRWVEGP